jgi:glucose-1-phosphate adenylyltransferase
MGIYVFSREALLGCLGEDSQNTFSCHDFGHSILPSMVGRDRVFAYKCTDYWRDIGTVEAYYEASLELLQERPPISMNGRWPVVTSQVEPAPVKILSGGVLNASLAGPGCVIRGQVCNSILSCDVVVAEGALVKDSLILPHCFIGKHCVIDHCILDEGVTIGAGCYIGFGPGSLLDGSADLTLVGTGADVPPHTIIGRNCRILPGTAHSDFTTSMVSSGSLISPVKS